MTPRYIIHVGPWKTATTYLQVCLKRTAPALKEQGILYPKEWCSGVSHYRQKGVYDAIARGRAEEMRPTFKQLNEQGHKAILLSCEHFIMLSEEGMETLRDVTGASDFQVVYAARRWSDRIGSLWNQNMMMGGVQNLPEFYMSMLAGEPPNLYPRKRAKQVVAGDVDYSVNFKIVENVFGRDALSIFPYSAITDRKENVFEAFCQGVLGLAEAPPTKGSENRRLASLPTEEQEMVRVLNGMHARAGGRPDGRTALTFKRLRKEMDTAAVAAALQQDITTLSIDDNSVHFDAAFANIEKYVDRLVGGGDTLFTRRAKKVKYVKPAYLLEPGVQAAFQAMYDRIAAAGPLHQGAGVSTDAAPAEAVAAPRRRGKKAQGRLKAAALWRPLGQTPHGVA